MREAEGLYRTEGGLIGEELDTETATIPQRHAEVLWTRLPHLGRATRQSQDNEYIVVVESTKPPKNRSQSLTQDQNTSQRVRLLSGEGIRVTAEGSGSGQMQHVEVWCSRDLQQCKRIRKEL